MDKVLFVSCDKLKKSTPIDYNVDDSILKPYIYRAQDIVVHQYLGTRLYDRLKTDVINSTLSGSYLTLFETYVQPAVIERAFYEALPFISLKLTNKSIVRGNSEWSIEADINDLKFLRNTVLDMAQFYGERLIDYLKQNNNLFVELSQNSGIDELQPQRKAYFGGLYTGEGNSDDCLFGLGLSRQEKRNWK